MSEKEPTTKKKVSTKATPSVQTLEAVVYAQTGTKKGTVSLPTSIFGLKWNADLVHSVVVGMLANARAGIAHTKDRSEVSGGGKKPWRQKGTGRARHGSSRSPIWVGGGTTFGPRNEKDYSKKINKKTRVKALFTVLSRKYTRGAILFVDSLSLDAIKTKDAAAIVASLSTIDSFEKVNSSKSTATLIVMPEVDPILAKSFNNLPGVTLTTTNELNAAIAMKYAHILIIDPTTTIGILEAKKK